MDFRILGPLEVIEDGQALDIGGQKQRALLAVLLLHANEAVSTDLLIDALWPDGPPDTASKALQVHVSHLRKALGRDRLETRAPGYVLHLSESELDLGRFRGLRAEGKFAEAIAEWRGAALADFELDRFAQGEIARLEAERLDCIEQRIEIELAEGGHPELVAELEALVREQPLRERLRGQLMLALYRAGRQAEALAAYQKGRRALLEELGIDPDRKLRELHQAILNQDPALDLGTGSDPSSPEAEPAPPEPSRHAPREARKVVTVLFADLVGSTELAESVDPESLRNVMSRYFDAMRIVLESHGGTVEKFIGDAVMAIFGVPVVHEDDALRAVRAAVEMREQLVTLNAELEPQWGIRLAVRIAVNTGEVVTGGAGEAQTYATGSVVNVASRLQSAAEAGEILIGGATYRLVRDSVEAEPLEPLTVKGRLAPVAALRVTTLQASEGADRGRFETPMVGRARERRRLNDAFEQSVGDRSCQLFTILGAAGVGKSRLVQEFLDEIAEGAQLAGGRCLPYGEGITFWPLLLAVREATGIEEADGTDEILAKLARALGNGADAPTVARRVAESVGLIEATESGEEGFAAVQLLFEALAADRPLVLVFDDVHWAESTFLDFLEYLADSRDAPVLLVCLARPELFDLRPGWGGGKLNATSVLLEPLSDDDTGLLIENLVGETQLAVEVRNRIVEAAEGNPLFVEEMLSMLIDDGSLVREADRWIPAHNLASVPVPSSIQALLAARLDRLEPDQRAVIERAAVEGKIFHAASVAAIAPDDLRSEVTANLETLVRKELIRPERSEAGDGRAFRFRHLLIRDAAYDSIPKAARAELHVLFARWLEQRGDAPATGEIVGYHLEQAYRYRAALGPVDDAGRNLARDAAAHLGLAGQRALARGDPAGAVNLMSRAVGLLPADDPSRVDLVPSIRVIQGLSGDLTWADRTLTETLGSSAAVDDRRLEAHALVQRGLLRLFTQPGVTAQQLFEVAEQAIPVFEQLDDDLGLARAWRLNAQAHYLCRRAGPSADASERALFYGRRAGSRLELREIVEWLCVALMLGPTPAPEMAARCGNLLPDIQADPILEPTALSVLANAEAMQGNAKQAAELIARWRAAVDELGDPVWLLAINLGFVSLADDPDEAEKDIQPWYDALIRIGEKSHFSSVAGHLARAKCRSGDYEEAIRLSTVSEETARPNDIHSHMLWRAARAEALAQTGDLVEGESLAHEAVAFAADSDFYDSHGDALVTLARVLLLASRSDKAPAALHDAIDLYELKGNLLSASRARALLDEV